MRNELFTKILKASEYIKSKIGERKPKTAIVLGSGMSNLIERAENVIEILYQDIPDFPISTVEGHMGSLIFATIKGKEVVIMNGRIHYYEGYSMNEVTFPINVLSLIGIENVIMTNAAGGINENLEVGDIMIITDHIKLTAESPLRGPNIDFFGERFPNMTNIYTKEYIDLIKEIGIDKKIELKEGIYYYWTGPQYETTAELNMIKILGGDAVGMSTVPEVITSAHVGLNILAISCITDKLLTRDTPLKHEEVLEVASHASQKIDTLIEECINRI